MSIRAAILSGAAAVAICSAAGICTVALAQSGYDNRYGSGPPTSSPEEVQQTDQLNQEQMNGAVSGNAAQSQFQDQQQQFNDQMQRYQQSRERYQESRQRYEYDRARYNARLAAYNLAQFEWSYPAPVVYRFGGYGVMPLYLVAEPSTQLWRAPVAGPGGRWVGRVRNVEIGPDGRPLRIEVALNRRVSVWVRPGDLRFDPDGRVLYTDLTREDLWNMPGATLVSAPL